MAFEKIDGALAQYYAGLGHNDYYNDDKIGKFLAYCKENGFEEDDIDEELANAPEDCMYPEFDDNFPLYPEIDDEKMRQKEIIYIIRYCYKYACRRHDYIVRIQDSMKDVTLYILAVSNFIQALIKNWGNQFIVPFQIDVPIALKKTSRVKEVQADCENLSGDDSDLTDDDDDSDDEKYEDKVGNVEEKLKFNKCSYHSFLMETNLNDYAKVTRSMMSAYNKYKETLSKSEHYKKNEDELKFYPKKKRFCIFVDRRLNDKDKLTIFEPPTMFSMPNKHVPEWYFYASKMCIVPGHGPLDKSDIERIASDSNMDGQIMSVSFQVESNDVIKCLLFWRGHYMRIYPQDLENIFEDIFDLNVCNNKKWNGKKRENVLKQIKIMDADFEHFYHQVSYKTYDNEFPRKYE